MVFRAWVLGILALAVSTFAYDITITCTIIDGTKPGSIRLPEASCAVYDAAFNFLKMSTTASSSPAPLTFTVPDGEYYLKATCDGFSDSPYVPMQKTSSTAGGRTISLSSKLATRDEKRTVVTWGAQPQDLDSHTALSPPWPCADVYYPDESRQCAISATQKINLDVDQRYGYGPETTTYTNVGLGRFRFYVHIYSADMLDDNEELVGTDFSLVKGLRVDLYSGSKKGGFLQSIELPDYASGRLWHAFNWLVKEEPANSGCRATYIEHVNAFFDNQAGGSDRFAGRIGKVQEVEFVDNSCAEMTQCGEVKPLDPYFNLFKVPQPPAPVSCQGTEVQPTSYPATNLTYEYLDDYASILSAQFGRLATNIMGVTELKNAYQKNIGSYQNNPLDGAAKVKSLASTLQTKFAAKAALVRRLGKVVYDRSGIQPSYIYDTVGPLDYQKCCDVADNLLKPDYSFAGLAVTRTQSCVDYPNIYFNIKNPKGAPTSTVLLNDLKLTKTLVSDAANGFKAIFNDVTNRGLSWLYFGSVNGLERSFPASKSDYCLSNYDPRFRPWYVQSASPLPKDVIVVLDRSNKMKLNSRIQTAINAANTVIATLTPNDYLSVFSFDDVGATMPGEQADPSLHRCYAETVVAASPFNKGKMNDFLLYSVCPTLDQTKSSYLSALNKVFTLLEEDEKRKAIRGTQREQILLFLSDGQAYENSTDILNALTQYQNSAMVPTKVFTYGLGAVYKGSTAEALLKSMAYQNNGNYTYVEDNGDLRSAMGTFYRSLTKTGDPTDPDHAPVSFSVPYLDEGGIGMVVSATMPVFTSVGTPTMLGVVGADITLDELVNELTHLPIGELSYPFLIDGTGRTYLHPSMPRPRQWQDASMWIDISFLERVPGFSEVRSSMISGGTGSKSFTSVKRTLPLGDAAGQGMREVTTDLSYFWAPIPGTNFSLALVLSPADLVNNAQIPNYNPVPMAVYHRIDVGVPAGETRCQYRGDFAVKDRSTVFIAASGFFNAAEYMGTNEDITRVNAMNSYFRSYDTKTTSNSPADFVKNDIRTTQALDDFWRLSANKPDGTLFSVWRYVATTNGVFRIFPGAKSSKGYDPRTQPFFLTPVAHPDKLTLTTPYVDPEDLSVYITLAQTVSNPNKADDIQAVVASDFTIQRFKMFMDKAMYYQCDKPGIRCMIMDDSGWLVYHPYFTNTSAAATNMSSIFIGEREPALAKYLMELSPTYFVPTVCNDFAGIQSKLAYKVNPAYATSKMQIDMPTGGSAAGVAYIAPIIGTNVYLVIVKSAQTHPKLGCRQVTECQCRDVGLLCASCTNPNNAWNTDFYDMLSYDGTSTMPVGKCRCPCTCPMPFNPCNVSSELPSIAENAALCPASARGSDEYMVPDDDFHYAMPSGQCVNYEDACGQVNVANYGSDWSLACKVALGCTIRNGRCEAAAVAEESGISGVAIAGIVIGVVVVVAVLAMVYFWMMRRGAAKKTEALARAREDEKQHRRQSEMEEERRREERRLEADRERQQQQERERQRQAMEMQTIVQMNTAPVAQPTAVQPQFVPVQYNPTQPTEGGAPVVYVIQPQAEGVYNVQPQGTAATAPASNPNDAPPAYTFNP